MILAITSTQNSQRGPAYAQQVLAAIHHGNTRRLPLTLGYGDSRQGVTLYCRFPDPLTTLVENQLATAYGSDCRCERVDDATFDPPTGYRRWTAEIRLCPQLYSFTLHSDYEDKLHHNLADPIAQILAAVGRDDHHRTHARLDIQLRPATQQRHRHARSAARVLALPFFDTHPRLESLFANTATHRCFLIRWFALAIAVQARASRAQGNRRSPRPTDVGQHLFETRLRVIVFAAKGDGWKAKAKLRQIAGSLAVFTVPRLARWYSRQGFLLSAGQLATLWHPPTETVRAPHMQTNSARDLEAPVTLPSEKEEETAVLGRVKFRSRRETFGIRYEDRRRHCFIVGKTGMGKSTLLSNMIRADVRAGRGVGLIDPHGDLCEAVLESMPKHRTNDVIYFDAGDRHHPLAFNPLDCSDPQQRPLVASGVLSAFKKLYGDSWGPRMEHIFRNALLALLEHRGTSLVSLQRLLSDTGYRKQIVGRLEDPVVRLFWQTEFASWKPHFQTEAVAPIQNKIGQFISNPLLRNIIGQSKTSLRLREAMDRQQVLIVNLSKGRIGEDASALLGSLLMSGLQLAAMSRADIEEQDRADFYLYVDEFQNFATDAFATTLSEARKYRLNLALANQYLDQLDEETYAAVFGNVGSLLAFQVGSQDAQRLAEQFAGDVEPADLINLPRYTAYLRLLVDGMPGRPFSMTTLPPTDNRHNDRAAIVRRTSQRRYGTPVGDVQRELACALGAR